MLASASLLMLVSPLMSTVPRLLIAPPVSATPLRLSVLVASTLTVPLSVMVVTVVVPSSVSVAAADRLQRCGIDDRFAGNVEFTAIGSERAGIGESHRLSQGSMVSVPLVEFDGAGVGDANIGDGAGAGRIECSVIGQCAVGENCADQVQRRASINRHRSAGGAVGVGYRCSRQLQRCCCRWPAAFRCW